LASDDFCWRLDFFLVLSCVCKYADINIGDGRFRRHWLSCCCRRLVLLGFWFRCVCFDGVNVCLVTGFASGVKADFHFLSLLFADACFFEFVGAKSLPLFMFAVYFFYCWFNVVHICLLPLSFFAVVFACASAVAWSRFFCAFAFAVVESSNVFACAG